MPSYAVLNSSLTTFCLPEVRVDSLSINIKGEFEVIKLIAELLVDLGGKAQFKRRTSHVPNLMQMSENNRFFSFALDSAHVKFDV